ncbi:MAG: dihydrodipicolinate synthase family protein [Rectinema sp.]
MDISVLSGIFAPMTTPFRDEEVDYDGIAANVEKMNSTGMKGYFVLGTNGEFKSLSVEERYRVLAQVVKYRAPGKVVMAGCGAESTKETIDLVKRAADTGAQMASVLMPCFFAKKMTDDVMAMHAFAVADASPIPIVLYNNPSVNAGVTIRLPLAQRLASHPNIVGVKDSSKETYRDNLKAASPTFRVLAGSAAYFLDLMKNGGTGGVLSLADVFPAECVRLYDAFMAGRLEEAEALNAQLIDLNTKVSGAYGVAGVKAAMDLVGFAGGAPRRPLRGLGQAEIAGLKSDLEHSGFLKR